MSDLTFSLPKTPDSKVVLNEHEARDVLAFFWPAKKPRLQNLTMTLDLRRYAQALLIVAIDASHAMGYLHILYNVFLRRKPGTSIKKLIKRVARKSAKHWWKYATEDYLEDPKIYDTVRVAIALKQREPFASHLNGTALATPTLKRRIVLDDINPGEEAWI